MAANDPLTPEELNTLQKSAATAATTVPVTVVPSSGLQPAEFLHLHNDWIEWPSDEHDSPDNLIIHIPPSEECRRSKLPHGGWPNPTDTVERDGPCGSCRQNPEKKFQAPHREPTEYSTVIVPDEEAQQVLDWWFSRYDTIPWDGRLHQLNRLAEEEIGRRVTLNGLQNTYVARAASMGFGLNMIKQQIGYQSVPQGRLRRVLREYGGFFDYEQLSIHDYLTALDREGPITPTELGDKVGRAKGTVQKKLNRLAKEGMVEKVTDSKPVAGGEATWVNTVPPNTKLICTYEGCDREFSGFVGRSQHEQKIH